MEYKTEYEDQQQENQEEQEAEVRKPGKILLKAAMMLGAFSLGVLMSVVTSDRYSLKDFLPPAIVEMAPDEQPEPTPAPTPLPTPVVELSPDTVFDSQALDELVDYVKDQPGHLSIWLCDLTTGVSFYHKDGRFYCASTMKAPYALWLCMRDERGEIDLDTSLDEGSGWELLHEMISKSSNSATRALSRKWPADQEHGFEDFLDEIGFSRSEGCEVMPGGIHGWITSRDGGRAMLAVYNYILTGSDNARNLEHAFLSADHDILWYPGAAAKKYGSWDGAFHDMAIVYGEKPYIISVFSDWASRENGMPKKAVARMQKIGHLAAAAVGIDEES